MLRDAAKRNGALLAKLEAQICGLRRRTIVGCRPTEVDHS